MYASQQWTKNLLGQTLKAAQEDGLLGGGGSVEGNLYYGIDRYTEDEVCIGEYLGKPLYRKMFIESNPNVTTAGTAAQKDIDVTSLAIEQPINVYGYIAGTTGFFSPLNSNINTSVYAAWLFKNTTLRIRCSDTSVNNAICVIVIEYTKTTDAPNSFTPSMVTNNLTIAGTAYEDYSEDEIVVGKWIDGKPLYRKLVIQAMSSHTGSSAISKSYNHNIMDVDHIHINAGASYYIMGGEICLPISYSYPNATTPVGISNLNSSGYNINSCGNRSDWKAYIFFEYTKTTDDEGSFTPSMVLGGVSNETASDADAQEVWA